MTWTSLERINRYGPLVVSFVLMAASACADTGFSLNGWPIRSIPRAIAHPRTQTVTPQAPVSESLFECGADFSPRGTSVPLFGFDAAEAGLKSRAG